MAKGLDYSKTCLKPPLKKKPKLLFKIDDPLMQVKYFWPSLS